MQAATGNTVTMAQAAINSLTDTINQGYDNWLSRTKFLAGLGALEVIKEEGTS